TACARRREDAQQVERRSADGRVGRLASAALQPNQAAFDAQYDVDAEAVGRDPQRSAFELRGALGRGDRFAHAALELPLDSLEKPGGHDSRTLQAEADMERNDAGRQIMIAAALEAAALHHALQRELIRMTPDRFGQIAVARRVAR